MTQRNKILHLLKENPEKWWYSYELIKVNTAWGWLGISADRRARELTEEGRLERKDEGKFVMYRYKFSDYENFHLKQYGI